MPVLTSGRNAAVFGFRAFAKRRWDVRLTAPFPYVHDSIENRKSVASLSRRSNLLVYYVEVDDMPPIPFRSASYMPWANRV